MANMPHCRFENTLHDLYDCEEHIYDEDLNPQEEEARKRLILLCKRILQGQDYIVTQRD